MKGRKILSNIVLQFSKNDLSRVKKYYENDITKIPPNSLFLAKLDTVTVVAYKSGKVMFQGGNAQQEAEKWQTLASGGTSKKPAVNEHKYQPSQSLFHQAHIGTDEAGTGDYFGPITVSAVYVSEENLPILKEMGITDSKTLTDARISNLAKEIVKLKIPYTLLTLDNQKYNKLQKKGWNQGKMKAMLHQHAIQKLLIKIADTPLHGILIDQFCQPSSYLKHIREEGIKLEKNTFLSFSTSVAAD